MKSASSVERWEDSEASIVTLYPISTIHISPSVRCVHHAIAGTCTSTVDPGEISKGTGKAEIEKNADEAEESDAAQAADEQKPNDGVEDRSTGDAGGCPDVVVDREVVVAERGEEVGEDAQDDDRAGELNNAEEEGDGF